MNNITNCSSVNFLFFVESRARLLQGKEGREEEYDRAEHARNLFMAVSQQPAQRGFNAPMRHAKTTIVLLLNPHTTKHDHTGLRSYQFPCELPEGKVPTKQEYRQMLDRYWQQIVQENPELGPSRQDYVQEQKWNALQKSPLFANQQRYEKAKAFMKKEGS